MLGQLEEHVTIQLMVMVEPKKISVQQSHLYIRLPDTWILAELLINIYSGVSLVYAPHIRTVPASCQGCSLVSVSDGSEGRHMSLDAVSGY